MAEGVPEAENRGAALELRRAELALKIKNKLRSRSGAVLRIVERMTLSSGFRNRLMM